MKMRIQIQFLSCLAVVVLLSGCVSGPGLAPGVWELHGNDGVVVDVEVSELRAGEYYFDAGTHPISGVYSLGDEQVSMLNPDNPRMKGFVWLVRPDRSLVLVEEAPIELSGKRLISSRLVGPK